MIIALHHTGIATRDLDRLSNFYMKLFSGENFGKLLVKVGEEPK